MESNCFWQLAGRQNQKNEVVASEMVGLNQYFLNFTKTYIIPGQTAFVLGAGCAVGCVPLWSEVLDNLLKRIEEVIGYGVPESEIRTDQKEPIIRFLKDHAKKADDRRRYGNFTHERLDALSRKVVDWLYLCELLHGWKFLCKYPNRNPYGVFRLTSLDSPIINYNQDHLIRLLDLPNKIYEPHGSIFKLLKTPVSFDDFQDIGYLYGSSRASDLYEKIDRKEKQLLEIAALEANRVVKNDSHNNGRLTPDFILPGDVESNIFLPKYDSNLSEIIRACIGYRTEIQRVRDPEKVFKRLVNKHGSEVAGEILKISNDDCNVGTWMDIIDSLKEIKKLVVIGFSFSPYDFGIIKSLKFLPVKPHIVLIDPNGLQIRSMLAHLLESERITTEPLDWMEYYEFMNTLIYRKKGGQTLKPL